MSEDHSACQLAKAWFHQFPHAKVLVNESCTELIRKDFQECLKHASIIEKPSTVKRTQTNSLRTCISSSVFETVEMIEAVEYLVQAMFSSDLPYFPSHIAFC